MRYIADPEPLTQALADLLDAVDPDGQNSAHWLDDYTDEQRDDLLNGRAAGLVKQYPAAIAARAALKKATADAGQVIPAVENHGCSDADLNELWELFDETVRAIAALRSGELVLDGSRDRLTLNAIYTGLRAAGYKLEPKLAGVVSALVSAHYQAGGHHQELGVALEIPTYTVKKRAARQKFTGKTTGERWALGELDNDELVPAEDLRPGWTVYDEEGNRLQVQEVRVFADGLVEVVVTEETSFSYSRGEVVTAVRHPAPFLRTTGHIVDPDSPAVAPKEIGLIAYARAPRRFPSYTQ